MGGLRAVRGNGDRERSESRARRESERVCVCACDGWYYHVIVGMGPSWTRTEAEVLSWLAAFRSMDRLVDVVRLVVCLEELMSGFCSIA